MPDYILPYIGIWLSVLLGLTVLTGRDTLAKFVVLEIALCYLLML
jgi:hypothetical protein